MSWLRVVFSLFQCACVGWVLGHFITKGIKLLPRWRNWWRKRRGIDVEEDFCPVHGTAGCPEPSIPALFGVMDEELSRMQGSPCSLCGARGASYLAMSPQGKKAVLCASCMHQRRSFN